MQSDVFDVMFRRAKKDGAVFALFPECPTEPRGTLTLCFQDDKFCGVLHSERAAKSVAATDDQATPLIHALEYNHQMRLNIIAKARPGYVQRRMARAQADAAFLAATDAE